MICNMQSYAILRKIYKYTKIQNFYLSDHTPWENAKIIIEPFSNDYTMNMRNERLVGTFFVQN